MTDSKPIAIIQMGVPPDSMRRRHGEPAAWFGQALGVTHDSLLIVRPDLGQALPAPDQFAVAIITGSWAMVTDHEDWSERTADWVRQIMAHKAPLIGVCYGHQIMAYALGGVVDDLPDGREIGAWPVTLNEAGRQDPLLQSCPQTFIANLSHAQAVLTTPKDAQVLATSARDAHQILRYNENALSLQFHPEFTPEILSACMVTHRSKTYHATPPASLPPTPQARQILLDFVRQQVAKKSVQLTVS